MINISNGITPTPTVSDPMVPGDAIRTFFRLTVRDANNVTDTEKFEVILKCVGASVAQQQITLHHCTVDTNDGTRYQWDIKFNFDATDSDNWKELFCKPFYDERNGNTPLNDIPYPDYYRLYLEGDNGFSISGGSLFNSPTMYSARSPTDDTPQPALKSGVLTLFYADSSVYGNIPVTMVLGANTTRNEQH